MGNHKCLITGCDLYISGEGKILHGDLHSLGGVWIFNGVLSNCEAAWDFTDDLLNRRCSPHTLALHGQYFERRGVIVFDPLHCTPNPAAMAYLRRT